MYIISDGPHCARVQLNTGPFTPCSGAADISAKDDEQPEEGDDASDSSVDCEAAVDDCEALLLALGNTRTAGECRVEVGQRGSTRPQESSARRPHE